jgi:hypothetical protein
MPTCFSNRTGMHGMSDLYGNKETRNDKVSQPSMRQWKRLLVLEVILSAVQLKLVVERRLALSDLSDLRYSFPRTIS